MSTSAPAAGTRTRARAALSFLLLLALGACASAGATLHSGVAPRTLERAPYYAGSTAAGASLAYLPIQYQRGAVDSPIFDPEGGEGTPMAALLTEMNAYLDSLHAGVRVAAADPAPGTPPDVRFGCEPDAFGECDDERRASGVLSSDAPLFRLEVGRPSAEWIAWAASALAAAPAEAVLVLTVEVGQYLPRQTNLRGSKVVELGSGHTASLPWLTSLDAPVSVLQLTGALVGADGRARRIGAEGMLARRTPLAASAFGGQRVVSDDDVAALRTARRDDLPGAPLAWQVALRTLVAGLTGRSALAGQ